MREYLVGVDIGGTSIKFGKFNLKGDLIDRWRIKTNKANNGSFILDDIAKSIGKRISFNQIKGIGLGVPGPVTNNIVLSCVNLGWSRKNLEKELKEIIKDSSIIIKAGNDASLPAAGEMYKGIAKGYKSVALFTLGTGVGGGLIINDQVLEGINGVSGELGHMVVDFRHNYHCNCGKQGCLETVASATGIVNLAKENLIKSKAKSKLRKFENFSAKKVIDFAKEGDFIAKKTIDESMKYLALAMSFVTFTTNPEIIVLGGGVSNAGSFLIDIIEKHYYQMVKPFISHTNFAIATLGNDAGIYGCCYLVK